MTFGQLLKRMAAGHVVYHRELRDTLLYGCQHCLKHWHEHAHGEGEGKCLFGPTEFKGFPHRSVAVYEDYHTGRLSSRKNFMRRKVT
jgi:hypothetical protein